MAPVTLQVVEVVVYGKSGGYRKAGDWFMLSNRVVGAHALGAGNQGLRSGAECVAYHMLVPQGSSGGTKALAAR